MTRSLQLSVCVLLVGFNATAVLGELVTYNVDLSAPAESTGHQLRAFGTIVADASMPISMSIESYDLHIQHESDPPLTFNEQTSIGAVDTALAWNVSDGDLYIRRLIDPSDDNQAIFGWRWKDGAGNIEAALGFSAGKGGANHFLAYSLHSLPGQREEAFLEPTGGPDDPPGFLIGTAVPEPSSAILFLAGLGAAAVFTMRRRKR